MDLSKIIFLVSWFIVLPILVIITILDYYYLDISPFDLEINMIIIIFFIIIIVFVFGFHSTFRDSSKYLFSWKKREKILKIGKPAKARIIDLREKDGGVESVNDQPFVTLELEVGGGSSKYRTEIKVIIGRLNIPKFQPGKIIDVKIDPENKMNVVIDYEGESLRKKK